MLQFDTNGLINEFLKNLYTEVYGACKAWKSEAMSKMRGIKFAHSNSRNYNLSNPQVLFEIDRQSKGIVAYLQANYVALADSYGVGSLMTSDNPGLQDYMKSDRWNKARRGKTIVGRPAGYQRPALGGKPRYYSGNMAGVQLERLRVYTKQKPSERDYYISPSYPSNAIQIANKWLKDTYLPRAYKNAVQNTNFSKFLIEKGD